MIFKFKSECHVTMEHHQGDLKSKHVATDFNIDVSDNLDKTRYLDKDGLPTAEGSKCATVCFVQGLVANIHFAHQNGFRDSADHLRYIIAELEKGFSTVADAHISNFKE